MVFDKELLDNIKNEKMKHGRWQRELAKEPSLKSLIGYKHL